MAKDTDLDKEKEEKKKKGEEDGDDEGGGGILVFIVAILIFFVWLAIIALLIRMDVGGFGSTILYPILKDVPVINRILPETEEYVEDEEDPYAFDSMDEAIDRIKYLEKQLAKAKKKNKNAQAQSEEYELLAAELQRYKDNEANFEKIKQKFYEEVVYSDQAPDIKQYKEYYESIEPQNAEKLYKQVVGEIKKDEELEKYVATYTAMKADEAAKIFDDMTKDLRLVGKILWAMDTDSRGKIMGKMDVDTAAAVTKLMEP